MPSPKRIQPGETIDLNLGVSEGLTIQQLTMVEPELAERTEKRGQNRMALSKRLRCRKAKEGLEFGRSEPVLRVRLPARVVLAIVSCGCS